MRTQPDMMTASDQNLHSILTPLKFHRFYGETARRNKCTECSLTYQFCICQKLLDLRKRRNCYQAETPQLNHAEDGSPRHEPNQKIQFHIRYDNNIKRTDLTESIIIDHNGGICGSDDKNVGPSTSLVYNDSERSIVHIEIYILMNIRGEMISTDQDVLVN